MAKTFVLNSALSFVKERFSLLHTKPGPITPSPHLGFEVMVLCCALKPAMGWHAENVVSECRERTGGQGYLSCNQFGELWAFAHAGITAEGDNRVLWAKVTKELLNIEKAQEDGLLKLSVLDMIIYLKSVVTSKESILIVTEVFQLLGERKKDHLQILTTPHSLYLWSHYQPVTLPTINGHRINTSLLKLYQGYPLDKCSFHRLMTHLSFPFVRDSSSKTHYQVGFFAFENEHAIASSS